MPLLNACSKKSALAPADVAGTGSYKLDGMLRTCQARATVPTFPGGNPPNTEYLTVELVTTPQPAGGAERLVLRFEKRTGGSYQLFYSELYPAGSTTQLYLFRSFLLTQSPVTPTGDGRFSGTFSGTSDAASGTVPPPYAAITEGQFTDVKPERRGTTRLADYQRATGDGQIIITVAEKANYRLLWENARAFHRYCERSFCSLDLSCNLRSGPALLTLPNPAPCPSLSGCFLPLCVTA